MAAIYTNLQTGTITDNPLLIGATAVNSAAFTTLPVVTAPDFLYITLDPTAVAGVPEIVRVTNHANAASVCTIVRAQQTSQGGGAARQHLLSTKWAMAGTAADMDDLPHRLLTAKGGLISASAANVSAVLAVGADGRELIADSSQALGLRWAVTETSLVTTKGDLLAATGAAALARLGAGADRTQLVADSSQATGLRWAAGLTTKGDLATFDTNEQRLAVGPNQQQLKADSSAGTGLAWTWDSVPIFANAAARDAAITVPIEGQLASTSDTDSLYIYSGAAWVEFAGHGGWVAFTPTWSGTLGNGSINGGWRRFGRTIHFRTQLTWGSTTSHSASNQSLTLPVVPNADYAANAPLGTGWTAVHGAAFYSGVALSSVASTTYFLLNSTGQVVTNTVPTTWATGDRFYVTGTYEAAS